MKNCVAILIVALATAGISADEIKSDQPVSVTGKLGFYTDKEDGFTITITADHVVVPLTTGTMLYRSQFPSSASLSIFLTMILDLRN